MNNMKEGLETQKLDTTCWYLPNKCFTQRHERISFNRYAVAKQMPEAGSLCDTSDMYQVSHWILTLQAGSDKHWVGLCHMLLDHHTYSSDKVGVLLNSSAGRETSSFRLSFLNRYTIVAAITRVG